MVYLIRFSAALALWAAAAGTLAAESGHGSHTRSAAQRRIPHEVVACPVPLRSGIGTLKDPVTTASPQAQAFYQQGMSYLHTYGWIEAARSFNQALRMDPGLAPAWVGLGRAMYQLDDTEAAQAAVAEAKKLSPKMTPREQRRIAIFAAGLEASIDPDNVEKEKAYLDAIETALAADPEDPELWLIRGNATEGPDGIGMGGGASAIAFYEAALHRASDHAGANHYLIHAFESIGKIPEAVKYGEIFARLAPQSPHAHHMYGHNLRRAGRVEEATREFETAYNLEMAYYARENILPEYDWHHPHNLSLLAMAYQYQGRLRDAERVLGQLFALEPVTPFIQFNRKALPEYLLVRGRPEEALKAAGDLAQGKYRFGRVGGHAMAGLAYVALGKAEEAEDELLAAEDEEDETVSPYVEILDAALLLKGDEAERDEAATILRNSMAEIRAIPGPDAWMLALFRLELIAGIARHAKEWDLAEDAARQMLEHDSAYPGAHFALALVLEQKGDAPHARKEFLEAERLWRHADPDLPELKAIKSRRA